MIGSAISIISSNSFKLSNVIVPDSIEICRLLICVPFPPYSESLVIILNNLFVFLLKKVEDCKYSKSSVISTLNLSCIAKLDP